MKHQVSHDVMGKRAMVRPWASKAYWVLERLVQEAEGIEHGTIGQLEGCGVIDERVALPEHLR